MNKYYNLFKIKDIKDKEITIEIKHYRKIITDKTIKLGDYIDEFVEI